MNHRSKQSPVNERHARQVRQPSALTRSAFTLLEVMVVVVLLTILLTAVMGVLRELLREAKQLEQASSDMFSETLAQQLRRDIINARIYRQRPGHLELWGYLAQDAGTSQPLLTHGIVTYHLRSNAQGQLLFRSHQAWAGSPATSNVDSSRRTDLTAGRSQPVWRGVASFFVTSNYIDQRDVSLQAPDQIQASMSGQMLDGTAWTPLSPEVEVIVIGEHENVLFRESIVRQEES